MYSLNKDPSRNRPAILAYYRNKGFAVLEFPVTNKYNVTVVASGALTSHILDFIGNMTNPDAVNFNCTGLPDCPEPETAKSPEKPEL